MGMKDEIKKLRDQLEYEKLQVRELKLLYWGLYEAVELYLEHPNERTKELVLGLMERPTT